jgi:hypothetical protein
MNAKRIQRMAVAALAAPAVLFAVAGTASADTHSSFSHCDQWGGGDGGGWNWRSDCRNFDHGGDHWGDHWGHHWGDGGDHWGHGW